MEWEQESLSLNEGKNFQPLTQGRSLTAKLQKTRDQFFSDRGTSDQAITGDLL